MTLTLQPRRLNAVVLVLAVAPLQLRAQRPTESEPLTLRQATVLALEHNPSVRAAAAAVDESRALVGQASAERLPQLGLHATATEFQEPMVTAPFHAFDPTAPPQFDRTLVQGQLQLGYTLFDGGARGARIRSARANAIAADARADAARMDMVASVAHAYFAVLSASGVLGAADTSLIALEAEQARVQQFLDEGRAARVDLLRVEAAIAQAEARQAWAAAQLEAAEHALARLIGVDRIRVASLSGVRLRVPTDLPDRDTLLAQLDAVSPSIAEAAGRMDAAVAARSVAHAAWLPTLQVVGGYHSYGSGAGDVTAEWQAGLRLSYALFTGGARSQAISAADARARMAQDRYELVRLQSADHLDRALTAVRSLAARAEATARAVDHLEEVVRIERLSLESGAGTQTDFLQAEAQLRTARADLAEARYAHIGALVDLARATGDLDVAWLDHTLENAQ